MRYAGWVGVWAVGVIGTLAFPARAAVAWNEGTQGDLSGNRNAPTLVPILVGDNDLIGSVQGGDLDYVRVDVPVGMQLAGLVVKSYSGFDQTAFAGVQRGTTFTVDSFAAQPGDLDGYAHFGPASGDILDDMGRGFDARGFTPPLGPGSYTFWIQQLGSTTQYDLNFRVTAVPEPAAGMVVVIGSLLARGRRRG
jgi:hypothetical protein